MVAMPETKTQTVLSIEEARAAEQTVKHGYRVSPSSLGKECERALWYSFRWVTPQTPHDGQLLRLFETGNIQEDRMLEDLRRIGCMVVEYDDPANKKQIGVTFADGHGYGFLDGEVTGLPEAPAAIHVVECKSHNTKNFAKVKAGGVEKIKPEHYAQTLIYMHLRNRKRGLYLIVNKDTDELHTERIEYDFKKAVALEKKAERIAFSPTPLPKLHEDPEKRAAWACRFCDHKSICHEGGGPESNCRTCVSSTPAAGGKWLCEFHGKELNREEQNAGCGQHLFIPDLVPGKQVDADVAEGWIEYAMPNGSTWRNEREAV